MNGGARNRIAECGCCCGGSGAGAHVNGGKTEAAYHRGDLLAKRRQMMEAWSAFCACPHNGTGVATALEGHTRENAMLAL